MNPMPRRPLRAVEVVERKAALRLASKVLRMDLRKIFQRAPLHQLSLKTEVGRRRHIQVEEVVAVAAVDIKMVVIPQIIILEEEEVEVDRIKEGPPGEVSHLLIRRRWKTPIDPIF